MIYDLSPLNRKSSISIEFLVDKNTKTNSDYSSIEENVKRIYTEISQTTDPVENDTKIDLSENDLQKFIDTICGEYNITCEKPAFETIQDVIDYVVSKLYESTDNVWDHQAFEDIKTRLDITLKMLDDYGVSEEGIGTGLLKIFVGVADLFIRVGNTFKTNLFKFYKDLKRSEIRFFFESHLLLCKTVEGQKFIDIMNEDIVVPTGMTSSYKKAIEYINSVYDVINLRAYADSLYDTLTDIRRQMTRGEDAYKRGFAATAQSATMLANQLRTAVGKQTQYFTDKAQAKTKPFKSVFSSMQELKDDRCALIDMERYLQDTKALIDQIDNIDVIMGDLTSYLTEDAEVDKKFVEQLATTIRFLATAFDVYGTCAMRQMALEHNLILVYEQLYKKI